MMSRRGKKNINELYQGCKCFSSLHTFFSGDSFCRQKITTQKIFTEAACELCVDEDYDFYVLLHF